MKKVLSGCLAGAMALAALVGAAACGSPAETADYDAPAYSDQGATLTLSGSVDKTSASSRISADLFGLFLEDINYASYALDDNLVCNGSFEYATDRDYTWSATKATIMVKTDENKLHVNNPYYALINVQAGGSIVNSGYRYVPMAVEYGTPLIFSAFIRNYAGDLTVRIKSTCTSAVYAEKTITVAESSDWVKYSTKVEPDMTGDSNIVLELVFAEADDDACIDSVTLETTDSTVGIKNYLYNVISDLSPSFLRFPGGCVIEGKSNSDYYDWKSSIGAEKVNGDDQLNGFTYTLRSDDGESVVTTYGEQATRTPNTDIWYQSEYYEMEYGIGFYEYFLLCESLGAKAIPVVSCGLSCQVQSSTVTALSGRHGNGISDFIQDAKDLICFAKGSVDSQDENEAYWAQVRTNMGHPEPFEMDYIGIGNEQWGAVYYQNYYEKFLEAFQAETNPLYQSVKLIVGNCTLFQNCENPKTGTTGEAQNYASQYLQKGKISSISEYGVVDQHYYMNYTDFLSNADLYDGYARPDTDPDTYYEVFVGEYSANAEAISSPTAGNTTYTEFFKNDMNGRNTWLTALSEAAMMTGFERNGDIVKLAAYAPMFGSLWDNTHNNYNQWWVNMMYYTNTSVVLTPNYYVQQLFMQNSGDYKVTSEISFTDEKPQTTYLSDGTATRVLDDIYYVTSMDEETGDVIVKIVNAGATDLKININVALTDVQLTGIAAVTELSGADGTAISTLVSGAVEPVSYKLGSFGDTLGYTAKGYSLTAIRFRTK